MKEKMAKFMFLIFILVAVVNENVSKPFHAPFRLSTFRDCVENYKEQQDLWKETNEHDQDRITSVMCFFEQHGIMNDDKTVNLENLDEVAPERGIKSSFRDCTFSVVAAAKVNDTKVDVYFAFAKCYTPSVIS